jgi:hypothetical protein
MDAMPSLDGTKVLCHKNLNKGSWSVTVGGKVVAHMPEIVLADVTFRVREKARQQVIERKCRQVHCWAVGTLVDVAPHGVRTPITYNPYRAGAFTRRSDGAPVDECEYVHFTKEEGAVAVGRVASRGRPNCPASDRFRDSRG